MKWKLIPGCVLATLIALLATPAQAQSGRALAAKEAAAAVIAKFGGKAGIVSKLATKIEQYAGKFGDDILQAVRKVGPRCFGLVDDAGKHGAKAARVLAHHGEAGAVHVLARPKAMAQFVRLGDDAAKAMVKHPRIGETLVAGAGLSAVRALNAVTPQSGRRLAMALDGPLAKSAHKVELLEVVARYGDRAATFVWENKGALAVGATCLAFLRDPEAFLGGSKRL